MFEDEFEKAGRPKSRLGDWLRAYADEADKYCYYMGGEPHVITIARFNGKWEAVVIDDEIENEGWDKA